MTDIQIAQAATTRPIKEIATKLGLDAEALDLYGRYKAKLPLSLIDPEKVKSSKLILVSAISPTPAGEGKTTVSIGLAEGLNRVGKKTIVVLREPSLGPVFGIKGGATGGGYSQVLPMEDINLHFTGDFNAVEKAHNLLAALIDNSLQNTTRNIGIDARTVTWKRVMDMNDRSLREVVVGLGGTKNGIPRQAGFDITAASEVMAILCLANDITDLKERLGNILVGYKIDGTPVLARDLNAHGAMAALLKDALKPNLVQTIDGTPAILHGGPFANIAQGTNTVLATKMGLSLADYVVTEAGFGFDLGGEKFLDIKCRYAGLSPATVVLVATIRALRYQGGVKVKDVSQPNLSAVKAGMVNLERHIDNVKLFGLTPVVALNYFLHDTPDEIKLVEEFCASKGAYCVVADVWGKGGAGAEQLATVVANVADGRPSTDFGRQTTNHFTPLYDWRLPVEEKITIIATKIYGAGTVRFTAKAKEALATIIKLDLQHLPICMAKTQKSLSDNATLRGAPRGFEAVVREIEIARGAGFLIPIMGDMMRMPGLPDTPAAERIDIDADGVISGLF
ncbi:MAG TPA: formate--tetrahydrofolate ligase [Candidatus Didemnitutus sp.]|nr:formate--tetrahydrofolate ligase [Candidatus Didemnitutus sp.]